MNPLNLKGVLPLRPSGTDNEFTTQDTRPANPQALSFPAFAQYTQAQENVIGAEATRRAPIMSLRELVRLYLEQAGEFGKPVTLSTFGFSPEETGRIFSGFDEDYHISRFLKFSEGAGQRFSINGFAATHVAIDSEIQSIL